MVVWLFQAGDKAMTQLREQEKKMRKIRRFVTGLLAAAVAASLVLTGCGGGKNGPDGSGGQEQDGGQELGGKKGGKVVITFAGWGSLAEKQNFTKMIDQFEKTHPGVKVNYQHYPGTERDYMVKLVSNVAANKMPDVFYLPTNEFVEWASAGRLLDMTDYLAKSELYYEKGRIWEKAVDMYYYNSETGAVGEDGGLYGLPKDLGPWAMVYNKTLFEQKGIPLPDPEEPMTLDEFVDVAKKLTSGSGVEKVYGTANYTLESAVWSNNADFLSEDKKTITVDTPEFAEALQWVADLALVHGVAPTTSEAAASGWFERWCNGKVGMAWMGPWDQPTFWESVTFEWDIMPTPVNAKTGKAISWLGSAALCVSSKSQEAQAAYELEEFLCMDEEAQTINCESGQAVPNIIELAENDYLAMDKMPANKRVFLDILKNPEKGQFKPTYYTKNSSWYDYFITEANKVYSGEMSAADFCKEIQPKLQERLKGNE